MNQRDLFVDVERVIGILLVIIGHTLIYSIFFETFELRLIFNFFYFAVPLFFFLSGYSLILSNENRVLPSFEKFRQKTTRKLIRPFMQWMIFYIGWSYIYYTVMQVLSNAPTTFTATLLVEKDFFRGFHLWFIFVLVFYYFIYWYLAKTEKYHKTSTLLYSFAVSLFFHAIQYLQVFSEDMFFFQFTPFPHIFYFVLGMWVRYHQQDIHKFILKNSWYLPVATLVLLLGFLFIELETLFGAIGFGVARISLIIFTVGVIMITRYIYSKLEVSRFELISDDADVDHPSIQGLITHLGKSVAGIYMIHVLILDIMTIFFTFLGWDLSSIIITIARNILIIIACYAIYTVPYALNNR